MKGELVVMASNLFANCKVYESFWLLVIKAAAESSVLVESEATGGDTIV